jgi:sugar phosphate isomerase/epimerase
MKLSLSTHLFAFHPLDEAVADLFPRYGFDAAEIWAMPPHFPLPDTAACDAAAALLSSRGVTVASLHAPLYPSVATYREDRWHCLSALDLEHRKASVDATEAAGSWLGRNGGGVLVVHTSFPARDWHPHRDEAFHASLRELLERLPPSVRIAVENTPQESGRSGTTLGIVDRYPAERVGICLDLAHAHIREDAVEAVRTCAPRLVHVHASDNRGDRDDHFVPGRGSLPWEAVLAALREARFEGRFTLELRDLTGVEGSPYGTFDEILSECRRFLDRRFPVGP